MGGSDTTTSSTNLADSGTTTGSTNLGDSDTTTSSTNDDFEEYEYEYYAENFGQDGDQEREDYGGGSVADEYKANLRFTEIVGKINR